MDPHLRTNASYRGKLLLFYRQQTWENKGTEQLSTWRRRRVSSLGTFGPHRC